MNVVRTRILGLTGGIALAVVVSVVPASGAPTPSLGLTVPSVDPTPVEIFNNWNVGGVFNGATSPTFTLDAPTVITGINTYHWNEGNGTTKVGSIGLRNVAKGTMYGPWRAVGKGMAGYTQKNPIWWVYPKVTLPPGEYAVIDSKPSTWAQNAESDEQGMSSVWGYETTLDTEVPVIDLPPFGSIVTPRSVDQADTVTYPVRIPYTVTDNSGKAYVNSVLYSDGQPVMRTRSTVPLSSGNHVYVLKSQPRFPNGSVAPGPFMLCLSAEDEAGNTSADVPQSACQWLSIAVPLVKVSNGCGTSEYGTAVADVLNWFADMRTYRGVDVYLRPACNMHDAGYAGVTVGDPIRGDYVDFRGWTRAAVDEKFVDDLRALCRRTLKNNKPALSDCYFEASIKYLQLVRKAGVGAFDADVTRPGVQTSTPTETNPPGGARNNQ